MSTAVRLLLCGIVVLYLTCIGALFMTPNPALMSSQSFSIAVSVFIAVAVALHLALGFMMRSWTGFLGSFASIVILAALVLAALMQLTGDSL